MPKVLGVIPARGGSKGLPRKNVRLLAGRPMIAWTIEAAWRSNCLDRIIVSTDDIEIAEIARQWGAEIPFLRPSELASDTASIVDVVLHTTDWLTKNEDYSTDWVMLLQPTSPLRDVEDIRGVIKLKHDRSAQAVVSLREAVHPPHWFRLMNEDGELIALANEPMPVRRQDTAPLYEFNGALYLIDLDILAQGRTFVPEPTLGYVMAPERSVDVDTLFDFRVAELLLQSGLSANTEVE